MNTLSTWIVAAAEDSVAPVVWLAVKFTVYLAILWIVHAMLRRLNPRWRVLLWRSSIAGFVVIAAFFCLPPLMSWSLPSPPASADRTVRVTTTRDVVSLVANQPSVDQGARGELTGDRTVPSGLSRPEGHGESDILPNHADASTYAVAPDRPDGAGAGLTWFDLARRSFSYLRAAEAIWCGGVLLGIIWTAIGLGRLVRIRARATEVPPWVVAELAQTACGLGLKCACAIRATRDLKSPCLMGFWRPAILIPERQSGSDSRTEMPSILAHELAHLRGGDLPWNALFHGLSILLWFHPLVWRVRIAHADACDAVADAIAADYVGDASQYVRTLALLTLRVASSDVTMGLSMARKSDARQRIEAIQRHIFRAPLSRSRATCAVSVAALGTVLLGGLGLNRTSVDSPPPVEAQRPGVPSTTREEVAQAPVLEPGIVSGEVVDAESLAPVARATVLLRDTQVHHATSDEKGRFRFEKISNGHYRIWAFKEELASPKERLLGLESPHLEGIRFAPIGLLMRPGKQVKLTVAAAGTGRPIAGAEVSLGYPDRRRAITGNDGVAVLRALLPEKYEITVLADGRAREDREIDLANSASVTSLSFALPAGGVVLGKITDKDHRPLAGVEVNYHPIGAGHGYSGQSPMTDEQGRHRNANLPLNTPVEIYCKSKDYLPATKVVTLTDDQKERQFDIQLEKKPRGGSVAGIVKDPEGKPISGAKVGNYGDQYDERRETTTDTNGRFVLHDLFKSYVGHEIVVRARGFSPALRKVEPGPEQSPSDASVRLTPGHFLHGRVENATGDPVTGAYVSISNGIGPFQARGQLRTDDQGRFDFDSLDQGNTFSISADAYSSREEVSLPFDGAAVVSVKLEPAGVLRGRVVDASTRQAIKQFRVRLGFPAEIRAGDVRGSFDSRLGVGRVFQVPDGTFMLSGLTNRLALEVTVEAEGYQRSLVPRVLVQPDGRAVPLEIALAKTDPTRFAAVSGTLLDHRRNPAAGVQVRLIVSTSASTGDGDNRFNWQAIDMGALGQMRYVAQFLSTVTDAQGRFVFRDILPGMYLQLAYWGPRAPKSRSLAFAKTKPGVGQTVTIDVPEPASVSGSFDAIAFSDSGSIALDRKDDPFHSYRFELTAGQADFQFENVPPGSYWLSVVHKPEHNKDQPAMFTLRPIASRSLIVEPGGSYKVQFAENDRVKQ